MKYDVIIIGAGAAGLMAMRELVNNGYKVCLLEASSVAGGRIASFSEEGFAEPVEAGAEFIHAHSPLTLEILKEAGIPCIPVKGEMIPVHGGEWLDSHKPDEKWNEFMRALKKQEQDTTVKDFLDLHFPAPAYGELRGAVQRFAEGFDLADLSKASLLSLKNEWKEIDEMQYRVAGGYCKLVDALLNHCLLPDSIIHYNTFVNKIQFTPGNVKVFTSNNTEYDSSKIIVTVSLGMLQAGEVAFDPHLGAHNTAIQELAFGSVIKCLFEFREPFWNTYHKNPGFILSDEWIPTWWTQLPAEMNLLTGWLGGSKAKLLSEQPEEKIMEVAMDSLSKIFRLPVSWIEDKYVHHYIICWDKDPLAKGGYSYNTLQSARAKKILAEPVYDTIYFAGEAMWAGDSPGTVEAALQSGKETAGKIMEKK